jgi:hypothetical protein
MPVIVLTPPAPPPPDGERLAPPPPPATMKTSIILTVDGTVNVPLAVIIDVENGLFAPKNDTVEVVNNEFS